VMEKRRTRGGDRTGRVRTELDRGVRQSPDLTLCFTGFDIFFGSSLLYE
jgi:hypothetical protein